MFTALHTLTHLRRTGSRFLVVLAIVALGTSVSIAQAPPWTWARGAGTNANQEALGVVTDAAGNVYTTGFIQGTNNNFAGNLFSSAGQDDIYISNYDPNGNYNWVVRAGGMSSDVGTSIAIDAAGNIYVCGHFSGTATFFGSPNINLTSAGSTDAFIAKYSSSGNVLWAVKAGGPSADRALAITCDGTNVFVTGAYQGTANFPTPLTSTGNEDVFIASYTAAAGTLSWVISGGSSFADRGQGIAYDNTGVYVTGYYGNGNCTFQNQTGSLTNIGLNDGFLVKYDLAGNGLWQLRLGSTTGNDECRSVSVAGTSLYVAGEFAGTINVYDASGSAAVATVAAVGTAEGFLLSYTSTTGTYNWFIQTQGTGNDGFYSVHALGSNVFASGTFMGTLPLPAQPAFTSTSNDGMIMKYSSAGTLVWAKQIEGTGIQRANGVYADANAVYATGIIQNTAIFDAASVTSFNSDDIFFAKAVDCEVTTANAGPDQIICSGSSTTLAANTPVIGTGSWNVISGSATVTSANNPASGVTGIAPGINMLEWVISNSPCISRDTIILFSDNVAPSITCPPNQNDFINSSCQFSVPDYTSLAAVLDMCASVSVVQNPVAGALLSAGSHTITLTATDPNGNSSGCNFTLTLVDTLSPVFTFCPGDSVYCNPNINFSPPTATDNCGAVTITQTDGTGLSSGSTFPVGITTLQFTATDTNGNTTICSFSITVMPAINATFNSAFPDTVCNASPDINLSSFVTLNASETSQFTCTVPGVFSSPGVFSPTLAGAGSFTITHIVNNGVCSDSASVVIHILPAYNASWVSPDTLCAAAGDVNLHSYLTTSDSSGTWYGTGVLGNMLQVNTIAGMNTTVTYTAGTGFCADTMVHTLFVAPDVNPAWAFLTDSVCNNSSPINLSALITGTTGGTWTGNGVSASLLNISSLSGNISITYSVGVSFCAESLSDNLFVIAAPVISAGADQSICGMSATLNGSGSGIWTSASPNISFTSSINPATTVTSIADGVYTLTWSNSLGGCMAIDSMVIQFATPPTANAGPDQSLSFTSNAALQAVIPALGAGLWVTSTPGVTISNPSSPQTTVTGLQEGNNVFQWQVTNGSCPVAIDEIIITVNALFIPDAFTPDGDGINDYLVIPGIENIENELEIYDRWGLVKFSAVNYKNDWDGTLSNGKQCTDDTYYYLLHIPGRDTIKGFLIIKR